MSTLNKIYFPNFQLKNQLIATFHLSYQHFGRALGTAPVVVINHALTGNSQITGPQGWWNDLVGEEKCIDLNRFSLVVFNIPGNGFGPEPREWIVNCEDYSSYDIAQLFWMGLDFLKIKSIYALIGGSLGGGIAWEMALQRPRALTHLIPIAASWRASDWIIGQVLIQEQILKNSSRPVHNARLHAMFLYRSPASIQQKFERRKHNDDLYESESWLLHHGKKLEERFDLSAYLLMNRLLKTIGEDWQWEDLQAFAIQTTASVTIIGVESDLFFSAKDDRATAEFLSLYSPQIDYLEIASIHGHDAFLIEFDQLNQYLKPLFKG